MNKLLTRNEAADILDVHPQTISNWVEKGLLSCVTIHNRKMIERSSFDKITDMLSNVADTEKKVSEYRECLKEEKQKLKDTINSLKREYRFLSNCKAEIKSFFSKSYKILSKGTESERTIDCVSRFLDGETYTEIGERYNISWQRTSQIVEKGIRMIGRVDSYKKIINDNKRLNKELEELNLKFKILQKSYYELQEQIEMTKSENDDVVLPKILSAKLIDFDFTVRCLNCLKSAEIETVYDLVMLEKKTILQFRNFGKKSLYELEDFLEAHGLRFGMTNNDLVNIKINK